MQINIIPNTSNYPVGKVADAELVFSNDPLTPPALQGLKLVGFAVWQSDKAPLGFNATVPARSYNQNGEKRNFALLRGVKDPDAAKLLKEVIVKAYLKVISELKPTPGMVHVGHQKPPSALKTVVNDDAEAGVMVALAELL